MIGSAMAEVPNKSAKPAYAEEQTIMQTEQHDAEPGFGSTASGKVHMDRHYLGAYGDTEGTVLLQRGGNTWRILRNGPIAMATGALLLVTPLLIFGFYFAVGPATPSEAPSGRAHRTFQPLAATGALVDRLQFYRAGADRPDHHVRQEGASCRGWAMMPSPPSPSSRNTSTTSSARCSSSARC